MNIKELNRQVCLLLDADPGDSRLNPVLEFGIIKPLSEGRSLSLVKEDAIERGDHGLVKVADFVSQFC